MQISTWRDSSISEPVGSCAAVPPEIVRLALHQTLKSTVSAALASALIVTPVFAISWTGMGSNGVRVITPPMSSRQHPFHVEHKDRAAIEQIFRSFPALPGVIDNVQRRLRVAASVRTLTDSEDGNTFIVAELASGLTERDERARFDDELDAILATDGQIQEVADVLIIMQA